MKEQLIKKLNELVENGTKKSTLETEIGLPANSLSAVLAGHKEMPDKWIDKINKYLKPIVVVDKVILEKVKANIAPPENNYEKLKGLKIVIDKINKDFGEGSVMCMGDVVKKQDN